MAEIIFIVPNKQLDEHFCGTAYERRGFYGYGQHIQINYCPLCDVFAFYECKKDGVSGIESHEIEDVLRDMGFYKKDKIRCKVIPIR